MRDLDDLLPRPGLPPGERVLVKLQACIWPGDTIGIRACVDLAREHGVPRAQVEEVLLQGVLFCGFPRIVNAFRVLNESWPANPPPAGGGLPIADQRQAGEDLFASIYAGATERVHEMLASLHGELHDFVLEAAYGRILSRPGLSPRLRELIAVGVLALTDQPRQLIAHGRGALRLGATLEEVHEAILTALGDEARTEAFVAQIGEARRGG